MAGLNHGPPDHVVNWTNAQVTRGGQVAAFEYATQTLLQIVPNDDMDRALAFNGYNEFADLIGMSLDDIDGLSYWDGDPDNLITSVPRGLTQRLKILVSMYLKWSHVRGGDIEISSVTLADFYTFRTEEYNPADPLGATHRAAITAPVVGIAPAPVHGHIAHAAGPTPAQQFDRGIKKDKDHYSEFKDEKYWDNFPCGVETKADIHGTSNVLDGAFIPNPTDPQAVELFTAQK